MKIREPDMVEDRIKRSKWYGNEEVISDVGKLIRCKDCKWSWCLNPNDETPFYVCRHPTLCNMRMSHEGNWYCGNGELKDGDGV